MMTKYNLINNSHVLYILLLYHCLIFYFVVNKYFANSSFLICKHTSIIILSGVLIKTRVESRKTHIKKSKYYIFICVT
jgi:hypothetical protein